MSEQPKPPSDEPKLPVTKPTADAPRPADRLKAKLTARKAVRRVKK